MQHHSTIKSLALLLVACAASLQAGVQHIASETEFNAIAQNTKPVVIKFSADWCGVCRSVEQQFNDISEEAEFKNNVQFVEVDIDKLQNVGKQSGIIGVPTFVYRHNGEIIDQTVGVEDMNTFKDGIRNAIRRNLLNTSIRSAAEVVDSMPEETGTTLDNEERAKQVVRDFVQGDQDHTKKGGVLGMIRGFIVGIFNLIKRILLLPITIVKALLGRN